MHHFRSTIIKDERDYLVNWWEKCLKAIHQLIPAYKIKVCDSNSNMKIVKLTTLEYFRINIVESRGNQPAGVGQATNNFVIHLQSTLRSNRFKQFQKYV